MEEIELRRIADTISEAVVRGVRASADYKLREKLQAEQKLSNQEVRSYLMWCEQTIREAFVKLAVAEDMLRERPPWRRSRLAEYEVRALMAMSYVRIRDKVVKKGKEVSGHGSNRAAFRRARFRR